MNPEPARQDCARLIGLVEAVADLAETHHQAELAGFARRAARRFEFSVAPSDRVAVAIHRREAAELLRRAHPEP